MDKAKIRLSPKEAELVLNTDWILTKNEIIQKVRLLLEQLQSDQEALLHNYAGLLPPEVLQVPPKISKGENYKGLPYLVLDYPRYFEKGNHFAIRTMFWWGNFFSITLHLSGIYKKMYATKIESSFSRLKEEGIFICVNEDEWEHHFEAGNYTSLGEMDITIFEEYVRNKQFLKLAKTYPLSQWDSSGKFLLDSFEKMIQQLIA